LLVVVIGAWCALATPEAQLAPLPPTAEGTAWTVAGASAAGFVGGALIAVPAVLSLPFGPLIGLSIGLPALALASAFGAFVAELGAARVPTALLVSGIAAGGTLLGTTLGVLAGWSIASIASTNDGVGPALGALAGAAVGGLAGSATGGGVGALWLTP
jgi:hypothetical protein